MSMHPKPGYDFNPGRNRDPNTEPEFNEGWTWDRFTRVLAAWIRENCEETKEERGQRVRREGQNP